MIDFNKIKGFISDMDGVIYHGNQILPGVREFVEWMQNVKLETIRKSVDNGITFESEQQFTNVSFPIIALAGEKEQKDVIDSVKRMAEINPYCRYELWEKAAHNIPPVFAKKFNDLILNLAR